MASAMAASMWVHGSACPPGNQGIMPDGSCQSAMWAAVTRIWSAVIRPGRSGAGIGGLSDLRQLLGAER